MWARTQCPLGPLWSKYTFYPLGSATRKATLSNKSFICLAKCTGGAIYPKNSIGTLFAQKRVCMRLPCTLLYPLAILSLPLSPALSSFVSFMFNDCQWAVANRPSTQPSSKCFSIKKVLIANISFLSSFLLIYLQVENVPFCAGAACVNYSKL